jgi:hypothetical protein
VLRLTFVWTSIPGAGVIALALPVGVVSREPGERVFTPVIDVALAVTLLTVLFTLSGLVRRRARNEK